MNAKCWKLEMLTFTVKMVTYFYEKNFTSHRKHFAQRIKENYKWATQPKQVAKSTDCLTTDNATIFFCSFFNYNFQDQQCRIPPLYSLALASWTCLSGFTSNLMCTLSGLNGVLGPLMLPKGVLAVNGVLSMHVVLSWCGGCERWIRWW